MDSFPQVLPKVIMNIEHIISNFKSGYAYAFFLDTTTIIMDNLKYTYVDIFFN